MIFFFLKVFHICEGGKKISFLCPNGTIFQQTDLICDWWFKVNCAASPGHYAESSEILSRAQGRNKNNAENRTNTEHVERKDVHRTSLKSSIKFDINEDVSNENYDFEDISLSNKQKSGQLIDRKGKSYSRDASKSLSEAQETAASTSFASSNHQQNSFSNNHKQNSFGNNQQQQNSFSGYHYREPDNKQFTFASTVPTTAASTKTTTQTPTTLATITSRRPSQSNNNNNNNNNVASATTQSPAITNAPPTVNEQNNQFNGYYYQEPERNSRRLGTTKPTPSYSAESTTIAPVTYPRRGTTTYKNSLKQNQFIINVADPTTRKERPTTTATTITTTQRDKFESIGTTKTPPLIRMNSNRVTTNSRIDTSRTTPFYTPTVPSVKTSTRPLTTASRGRNSNRVTTESNDFRPTASTIEVAEHAMEMMKTLHELKLDAESSTIETEREMGGRPGLVIPPSSGPEAIHSLALYFATASDANSPMPTDPTTIQAHKGLDVTVGNVTKIDSTLVSDVTKKHYETLFGLEEERQKQLSIINQSTKATTTTTEIPLGLRLDLESQVPSRDNNDLETEFSNNPITAAAGSTQIRELAQVFTHALSAYLHDPATFRRVLSEIRPTEPSVTRGAEFLTNRSGRTEDFNNGTGPTYLPTVSVTGTTPLTPTTEDDEVLDFSDVTLSTIRPQATTGSSTDSGEIGTTQFEAQSTTLSPTTNSPEFFTTTHSNILKDSLKHIDHVPASRILTEALENFALQYTNNALTETTTLPSNPLAIEINEGFEATTNYPYFEELETNNTSSYSEDNHKIYNDNDKQQTNLTSILTTVQPSGKLISESLKFDLLPPAIVNKAFDLPTSDVLPPVDENDLQRAQSQSIYGDNKNKIDQRKGKEYKDDKQSANSLRTDNGHFITQITPTATPSPDLSHSTSPDTDKITNPWSTFAYTVFLDPLTINDGLMSSNEQSTITPSPHTYLPQSTQNPPIDSTEPTRNEYGSRLSLKELAAGKSSSEHRQGKTITTTIQPPVTHGEYMDVMQKKANEMFGKLNDSSASHLMNVMKKADKNKTVRRLILLLVQTCDDDYNTTVEQSRQALLNALIGLDGKIDDDSDFQIIHSNRRGKQLKQSASSSIINAANALTTTTQLPITTYHRPLSLRFEATTSNQIPFNQYESTTTSSIEPFETTTEYHFTGYPDRIRDYSTLASDIETTTFDYQTPTTVLPTTTTTVPTTTTTTTTVRPTTSVPRTTPGRRPQTRNAKRISKDLDAYLSHQNDSKLEVNATHKNSDARALELLKSLYSLAGRFGK